MQKTSFLEIYACMALCQEPPKLTPPAAWFFEMYAKKLVFYEVFGEGLEKCHWERGRGEGKPSPPRRV